MGMGKLVGCQYILNDGQLVRECAAVSLRFGEVLVVDVDIQFEGLFNPSNANTNRTLLAWSQTDAVQFI
jgi:hypothetical protein